MLSRLTRAVADLSIRSGPNSQSRSLVTLGSSSQGQTGSLLSTAVAGLTGRTGTSLLAPTISTALILNKRTYFSAMDDLGRGETFADGYGIKLYDEKHGRRTSLKAVELRFKRLDWGMWIRTRGGRDKKWWKKTRAQLIKGQKHYFCMRYHNHRFDRAVTSHIKEIRHIPEDPYRVYNDLSWQDNIATKRRNSELVKNYGNKIYKMDWFLAHANNHPSRKSREYRYWYEPPHYHKNIADGDGVYTPDPTIPYDNPAPHFQYEQRNFNRNQRLVEKKYQKQLRDWAPYTEDGYISQSSMLKLPQYGTKLG